MYQYDQYRCVYLCSYILYNDNDFVNFTFSKEMYIEKKKCILIKDVICLFRISYL